MARVLGILAFLCLLIGLIGGSILYNKQIQAFSASYLIEKDARRAIETGQIEAAMGVYRKAHEEHPDNPAYGVMLAKLYQRQGNGAKAERIYREVLAKAPDDLQANLGYAGLLRQDKKRLNEAILQYRRALRTHRGDPTLLTGLADTYKEAAENPSERRTPMKRWLYDWAIYYYRVSLRNNPELFKSHFNLGVVYHELGKPDEAATRYCKALVLSPDSYEAHYNLGLALVDLHAYETGFKHLDHAIKLLSVRDRIVLAQQLAERSQMVKTRIQNQIEHIRDEGAIPVPADLQPHCLPIAETPEEGTAEIR